MYRVYGFHCGNRFEVIVPDYECIDRIEDTYGVVIWGYEYLE